jgi:CBS domain-containing protein
MVQVKKMSKTVAEVMSRDPILVHPQTPLKEAIQILAEKRISGLPVVDDAGKLVGIISETDLMWQETGVTPPDKPLREAAKLIQDHKVHRLPVLDSAGKVIGILTRGDIVRTMAAD